MNKDLESIAFDEQTIKNAVKVLGERLAADYKDKDPIFICILKGSFIFASDLLRETELNCDIDFMVVSSYGNAAVSSGKVNIKKDVSADIKGRDVIIVEDILDTARTLSCVRDYLLTKQPASLKLCTLLDKVTAKRFGDVKADYKCFDVEDQFLVGYGLDYAEKYRGLKYIGVLKKEIYTH